MSTRFGPEKGDFGSKSGRDTVRLSQRYPPLLRAIGFLMSQYGQLGAIPPPPSEHFPLESMQSGGAIPPPRKGYLSDTCPIPYENKANGCDAPICDTISKGYCAIGGGISHWAAKIQLCKVLTLQQEKAGLAELQRRAADVRKKREHRTDPSTLLRFLRARKGDVDKVRESAGTYHPATNDDLPV